MSVDTFAPGTDSSSLWLDASLSSGGAGQQCPREKPDVQAQAGSRPGRLLWLSPSIEGESAATLGSVSTAGSQLLGVQHLGGSWFAWLSTQPQGEEHYLLLAKASSRKSGG